MATILLSAAGAALGGAIGGPVGALAGRAVGASVGYMIDRALIRSTLPDTKGPRLSDLDIQTATEGKAIPRVYGRVRLAGQVIWATRHEETVKKKETSGGKGGPTTSTYRYHANVAVGICEGPVARIGRIWADGVELDRTDHQIRFHLGDEDQAPDPLILARQPGGAPAYRGLAYVVFEHFPLKAYGNRLPQFSFEVIRVVDRLEPLVRAVTLIPGATEFGYATAPVSGGSAAGGWRSENVHQTTAPTDLEASLDELQALCPNLERVSLVVSWFGDDLRAGVCRLRPGVESNAKTTTQDWSVAGVDRAAARAVSTASGSPAYGGTPSDATVAAAIRAIRARGLKVVLYPFVMMDVPAGNGLPDPYGAAEQAAYPWRGRITCHPAPGRPGSPDKSAAAGTQVQAFVGTALPAHYTVDVDQVAYTGPAEWTFRRMVLHYAALAAAAGGVDGFLIGSELRGLTTVRSSASAYPFVAALATLAADVRSLVGPAATLTYAADWTEWFGHQPQDGTGDVFFHLDPLWAHPAVDVVGIDAYWPLSDWRYGDHADRSLADGPWDVAYLRANLEAGEGYDWFYANAAARSAGLRSPITDGARAKPWVFRNKDLRSWWSNQHFDRPGGIESATPTAWVPQSKPFWLTEAGAPAVDLGSNQPNLFPDAKSSESGVPWFSRGARDDLVPRRHAEAVISRFDPAAPGFQPAWNPVSTLTGKRMVDPSGIHLWTWDARPFPAFPALGATWADAPAWSTGHWLTGRLGGTSLQGLLAALLAEAGVVAVAWRGVGGHLDGYVVDDRMSARQAIEPLLAAFQVDALDLGTGIAFAGRGRSPGLSLGLDDLAEAGEDARFEIRRAEEAELPRSVAVTVSDPLRDFRRTTVESARLVGSSRRETRADLPVVAAIETMASRAEIWLQDVWAGRETVAFSLPPSRLAVEPGDVLALDLGSRALTVQVERVEAAGRLAVEARSLDPDLYAPVRARGGPATVAATAALGAPLVHVLDVARPDAGAPLHRPWIAAHVRPWPGGLAVWQRQPDGSYDLAATLDGSAAMGELLASMPPGPTARWDRGTAVDVRLYGGHLVSATPDAVLAGANLAAVRHTAGQWELFRFCDATLTAPSTYRLTRLLRAESGSEDAWAAPAPAGSPFVLLDDALADLPIGIDALDRALDLRVGPASKPYDHPAYAPVSATPAGRGLLPWSPVHPRARRDRATGAVALSWIRRSRVEGGDGWGAGDVPLGEETEAYRLEILLGSTVMRRVETTAPGHLYAAPDQIADFGAPPSSLTVRIAQVSATRGPGVPRTATLAL
ncbi:baseplate multidomain protein megatron [Prosthecomicrobium sp. N25]|uniref:baseplate multidomain protein megatron n=1 Tax=Prosthecomicrobium sp. N25 TaxID=3129254 RepID=UPI0030784FA1